MFRVNYYKGHCHGVAACSSLLWNTWEERRETTKPRVSPGFPIALAKALLMPLPGLRFEDCFWNEVLLGTSGTPEVTLGSFSTAGEAALFHCALHPTLEPRSQELRRLNTLLCNLPILKHELPDYSVVSPSFKKDSRVKKIKNKIPVKPSYPTAPHLYLYSLRPWEYVNMCHSFRTSKTL